MKKILSILLSSLCLTFGFCLIGCSMKKSIIPTNNYYTDFEGIYITIESVDTTGEHAKLNVQWHNDTDYEIIYSSPYQIEYKKGNEWINIQTVDFNCDYLEISIAPHSTKTEDYSTSYFNVAKTGMYRLRTSCIILTDDNPTCLLWVEFSLK